MNESKLQAKVTLAAFINTKSMPGKTVVSSGNLQMKFVSWEILALFGSILVMSCGSNDTLSGNQNKTNCIYLEPGEPKQVRFIKSNSERQYATFCIKSEPGKIYLLSIDKTTTTMMNTNSLAKFYFQVLKNDSRIGRSQQDTLVFAVDENRISKLEMYTYDFAHDSATINLTVLNKMAWWAMPRDSIKLHENNGNSQSNPNQISPYATASTIDTNATWETSGFIETNFSDEQRLRTQYDSTASFSEWHKVSLDSGSKYVLHLQYLRGFGPYVEFFDTTRASVSPDNGTSWCDDYAVCQIDFDFTPSSSSTLYIHFGAQISSWRFADVRFRYGIELTKQQ